MISALGMYDRTETKAAHDALWSEIRSHLGYGPDHLSRDIDFWEVWRSPDLLLSQTCGLPYRAVLHSDVTLVGTPSYDIQGLEDGTYCSVIVAHVDRSSDPIASFDSQKLAFNEPLSQSGWAAPYEYLRNAGLKIGDTLQTGAHRASAEAVARREADFAALDIVTWTLIQRYDAFAANLVEVERTRPTPGLPLITSLGRDPEPLANAFKAALSTLPKEHLDTLLITGLSTHSKEDYLSIPIPPTPSDA